ncbi:MULTISPECIES: potassium-transporting ATPase subunit KdpC [Terrisporobacter]|uniref:Potassium-transporting ATPase KdpC subunit n=1 Tax=Terrisporobacter petrolearius TaxID=1460447 RepID=A0ABZ3FHZ0_9FIRM|nr:MULTISPECIES: potassium-transporting ATPase subunit KdpC [Terrisporobacter]MBN9646757.1 potassium-transporting ATPase subunit KdpC [Terrisporobacter glycolicus]
MKSIFCKGVSSFIIFTLLCGVIYTGAITVIAQAFFPSKANGSIIEVDGKKYGSELVAQQYTDEKHMWGRIMNIDTKTFTDENGNKVLYSTPSNLSPSSDKYEKLVKERVDKIKSSHEYNKSQAVPVDLVTCSGSGLDPEISLAAAKYQVKRIADNNNMTESQVNDIINKCTNKPFLGVLGETTVNVLKVNLMIDGILS